VSAGRWARDALVMPYSVSKPFSAVCALLLVERGLLTLDAPGRCYWPELAGMRPCAGLLTCGPCWPVPPPLIRTTPMNVRLARPIVVGRVLARVTTLGDLWNPLRPLDHRPNTCLLLVTTGGL
jgi:CubicO group peptidase (beta-lactamase class C family)